MPSQGERGSQGEQGGRRSQGIRVLGVDPGTRVVGWAVLDVLARGRVSVVACGALRLEPGELHRRLLEIHDGLEALILEHRPEVLAVETVFHGKSFQSVLKVGEARGVVLLMGARHGLVVREFTPAMVKKTATGNGQAAKSQVRSMMVRLLALETLPRPTDVSDALAIAFCYGQRAWRDVRIGAADPRPGRGGRGAAARSGGDHGRRG